MISILVVSVKTAEKNLNQDLIRLLMRRSNFTIGHSLFDILRFILVDFEERGGLRGRSSKKVSNFVPSFIPVHLQISGPYGCPSRSSILCGYSDPMSPPFGL